MAKKISDDQLVLDIIINGNSARSQIVALTKSVSDAETKVSKLNKELRKNEETLDSLSKAGKQESEQYKQVSGTCANLTAEINKHNETISVGKKRIDLLTNGLRDEDKTISDLKRDYSRLIK